MPRKRGEFHPYGKIADTGKDCQACSGNLPSANLHLERDSGALFEWLADADRNRAALAGLF